MKKFFAKFYATNWPEEVSVVKKVRNNDISDLKGEEMFGRFHEKQLQKTNQKRV